MHAGPHADPLRLHRATLQDVKEFEFDTWMHSAAGAYLSTFVPEADAEAVGFLAVALWLPVHHSCMALGMFTRPA